MEIALWKAENLVESIFFFSYNSFYSYLFESW